MNLRAKWIERGHWMDSPIKHLERQKPNSVFKLEMLDNQEIQHKIIDLMGLFPAYNRYSHVQHSTGAVEICADIREKLFNYGFYGLMSDVRKVAKRARDHKGECVLMNNHSHVKLMEVIYTAHILEIKPSDIVMNLACGNTYWANVWLAEQCRMLYTNDNGYYTPLHDSETREFHYNEYRPGIIDKIDFVEFDASLLFPYPNGMFDKIVSHSSIEHIDNWDVNVLPEILRVLKPGGSCGLASAFHPLGEENLGEGQYSWWTKDKWSRFVGLQKELGFEIIGNTEYNYGMPWRAEEDTGSYKFGGSVYIVNFIFFRKSLYGHT